MISDIYEYRAAQRALALFERGAPGIKELTDSPGLLAVLLEMHRAQGETFIDEDMLLSDMARRGPEEED